MSLMNSVYWHLDLCGMLCCIKITQANAMVFQITLQHYVTLLGPAMDRHCRKFMLTKIPGNKLELIIGKGYMLDVMTGNVLDMMTENMLDVNIGNKLDVMTGSKLDVTAANKLEAMVGNMFRRISLFKKICLHKMQRLQ